MRIITATRTAITAITTIMSARRRAAHIAGA
jgi:hypothetical protein